MEIRILHHEKIEKHERGTGFTALQQIPACGILQSYRTRFIDPCPDDRRADLRGRTGTSEQRQ